MKYKMYLKKRKLSFLKTASCAKPRIFHVMLLTHTSVHCSVPLSVYNSVLCAFESAGVQRTDNKGWK